MENPKIPLSFIGMLLMLNVNLPLLRKNENFNYHWYFELLQFLENQGLMEQFVRKQL
jgi:hypothetical protein